MSDIRWEEAAENELGIETIAIKTEDAKLGCTRIVGYNGILKDDVVEYEGEVYTVVMVSRLGDFGLSLTGTLPYTLRVSPVSVRKMKNFQGNYYSSRFDKKDET